MLKLSFKKPIPIKILKFKIVYLKENFQRLVFKLKLSFKKIIFYCLFQCNKFENLFFSKPIDNQIINFFISIQRQLQNLNVKLFQNNFYLIPSYSNKFKIFLNYDILKRTF